MRRDTYVELLTKHEDVSVALVDIWQAPPPASKSAGALHPLYEPIDHLRGLNIAVSAVYLEGPDSVRDAATEIMDRYNEETAMIKRIADDNIGKSEMLVELAKTSLDALHDERDKVRYEFISEATDALK